jgi:chromosomal replication initiation ATPase DnaA
MGDASAAFLARIIEATCGLYGMERDELTGPDRGHAISGARHAAFLAAAMFGEEPKNIKRAFNRDQTSVAYGIARASKHPEIRAAAQAIADRAEAHFPAWVAMTPFRRHDTFCLETPGRRR